MAEHEDDPVLSDLARILYGKEEIDIPAGILDRVKDADRKLKEETSLGKVIRDGLESLLDKGSPDLPRQAAFAFEGDEEQELPEEDPIEEMLGDGD